MSAESWTIIAVGAALAGLQWGTYARMPAWTASRNVCYFQVIHLYSKRFK